MKPVALVAVFAFLLSALPLMAQQAQTSSTLTQPRTSPHDTISVRLSGGAPAAGARGRGGMSGPLVTIYYGRPYMADPRTKQPRQIWGGLVPWNQVWRLGADEGTTLISQTDLVFGEFTLPAGAYTLEMLPVQEGTSKLIINKAVGYWGIPYSAIQAQELTRLDMKKEPDVDKSVDQLTLSLENNAGTGTLKVTWDKSVYSIAFKAKS
jgi:hypothetical protein